MSTNRFRFDFILKKATYETENDCPYLIPKLEEIAKLINSMTGRISPEKFLSDMFECGAIAISNKFDLTQYDKREERYKQIITGYDKPEQMAMADIFGKLYALLASSVYDNGVFNDWLGELFMRYSLGNSKAGQFFTPFHISQMCAKMTVDEATVKAKADNDEILTLYEPCCGSGGMVLALINVLYKDYNVNYARNCFVVCEDIDARCAHMCYLQLSLAGVPAIIKQQNALSRELWQVWRTPAYLLQFMRFRQFEDCTMEA